MIKITEVSLSPNPAKPGESLILRVRAAEEIATWKDVRTALWGTLRALSWDGVRRKLFGA